MSNQLGNLAVNMILNHQSNHWIPISGPQRAFGQQGSDLWQRMANGKTARSFSCYCPGLDHANGLWRSNPGFRSTARKGHDPLEVDEEVHAPSSMWWRKEKSVLPAEGYGDELDWNYWRRKKTIIDLLILLCRLTSSLRALNDLIISLWLSTI